MMLMQTMPIGFVEGFDIDELNKFILQMSARVLIFWGNLISVDLSEIYEVRKP